MLISNILHESDLPHIEGLHYWRLAWVGIRQAIYILRRWAASEGRHPSSKRYDSAE
jgi:hypothetical protein